MTRYSNDPDAPAFPTDSEHQSGKNTYHMTGMTIRQYAAIHLRVADSGEKWLNDMICKSLENENTLKELNQSP